MNTYDQLNELGKRYERPVYFVELDPSYQRFPGMMDLISKVSVMVYSVVLDTSTIDFHS